jgi:hypothetical protein
MNFLIKYIIHYVYIDIIGYHFDYNSGNLDESMLEILRLWPSDEQISQTIKHSHQLARELTEFLGMIQPRDIPIDFPQLLISTHEEEVSTSGTGDYHENNKQNENTEPNFSVAIAEASCEMRRISTEEYSEDSSNLLQEGVSQLTKIDQVSEELSVLYNGDSSKLRIFKTLFIFFNYSLLI